MSRKSENNPIVKTIVRNTAVKIDKSYDKVIDEFSVQALQKSSVDVEQPKQKGILKNNANSMSNLANPACNSTKAIAKRIERLEEESQKLAVIRPDKTTTALENKSVKLSNFHLNKRLYKDLVSLNLNDEQVSQRSKSPSSRRKYSSTHSKDLVPDLKDFQENVIKVDKPVMVSAVPVKYSAEPTYDTHDLYDKVNSWKPE